MKFYSLPLDVRRRKAERFRERYQTDPEFRERSRKLAAARQARFRERHRQEA